VTSANESVTIDHWIDDTAYREFRHAHAAGYEALDKRFDTLTEVEEHLGI
jgi:hypothetical protein